MLQAQCGRLLRWLEREQVHNNLAIALHRLGRGAECLKELGTTEAAVATDKSKLRAHFAGAPMDFERYLPIARTAWRVQRACSGSNGSDEWHSVESSKPESPGGLPEAP